MPKHNVSKRPTKPSVSGQKTNPKMEQKVRSLQGQLRSMTTNGTKVSSAGNLCVSLQEFWTGALPITVDGTTPPVTLDFRPGATGIVRLDQFSNLFELWRLKRCRLLYKTATGTTQSGLLHMGVDFDSGDLPNSVRGVAALNPVLTVPVWKDGSLQVPVDRVNRATWMYTAAGLAPHPDTSSGFTAAIALTGATPNPGEVWIDYEIELSGPISPTGSTFSTQQSNQIVSTIPYLRAGIDNSINPVNSGWTTYQGGLFNYYLGYLRNGLTNVVTLQQPTAGTVRALFNYVGLRPNQLYYLLGRWLDNTTSVGTATYSIGTGDDGGVPFGQVNDSPSHEWGSSTWAGGLITGSDGTLTGEVTWDVGTLSSGQTSVGVVVFTLSSFGYSPTSKFPDGLSSWTLG